MMNDRPSIVYRFTLREAIRLFQPAGFPILPGERLSNWSMDNLEAGAALCGFDIERLQPCGYEPRRPTHDERSPD